MLFRHRVCTRLKGHCSRYTSCSEPVTSSFLLSWWSLTAGRSFSSSDTVEDVIQEIHREPSLLTEMERLAGGRLTECFVLPVELQSKSLTHYHVKSTSVPFCAHVFFQWSHCLLQYISLECLFVQISGLDVSAYYFSCCQCLSPKEMLWELSLLPLLFQEVKLVLHFYFRYYKKHICRCYLESSLCWRALRKSLDL